MDDYALLDFMIDVCDSGGRYSDKIVKSFRRIMGLESPVVVAVLSTTVLPVDGLYDVRTLSPYEEDIVRPLN